MTEDIRDRPGLGHEDVVQLNFIRTRVPFLFRRHYRTGLRSHIMEVLNPAHVTAQEQGVMIDHVRWFPKAEPIRMLRIFRTRFKDFGEAREELKRVKIVDQYLGPAHVARSEEFLVDYARGPGREMLLCGLQEYVKGERIDPWGRLDGEYLKTLMARLHADTQAPLRPSPGTWLLQVRQTARSFLARIRRMIRETQLIPDLAGVGNLMMTVSGNMKVVDINNISRVLAEPSIYLDDKGYPVCDKSVQALARIQEGLAGVLVDETDALYRVFLESSRLRRVEKRVRAFHMNAGLSLSGSSYPRA